jgi:uncharacterized protein (DUF433 family)
VTRRANPFDPYGGQDPREIPAYTPVQAAHYLWVPEATLRSWIGGRSAPAGHTRRRAAPVVSPADPHDGLLSFVNLLELHVLSAIRRHHGVEMKRVRAAIDYLAERYGHRHPLIDEKMETDGKDLFIAKLGQFENVSCSGQLAMRELLDVHLKRIEWNEKGLAVRLFPFTRQRGDLADAPRFLAIDPRVAFGRPVIVGSRVPTSEIVERFRAGESRETLMAEYGRSAEEIEEALRIEFRTAA